MEDPVLQLRSRFLYVRLKMLVRKEPVQLRDTDSMM